MSVYIYNTTTFTDKHNNYYKKTTYIPCHYLASPSLVSTDGQIRPSSCLRVNAYPETSTSGLWSDVP